MVSGYFVVQKFFEFYFRHSVVLKLLPTRGIAKVFVQKVNPLYVLFIFWNWFQKQVLPVSSEPLLIYKLSIATQDFFMLFIDLKRNKEDYRQRGVFARNNFMLYWLWGKTSGGENFLLIWRKEHYRQRG